MFRCARRVVGVRSGTDFVAFLDSSRGGILSLLALEAAVSLSADSLVGPNLIFFIITLNLPVSVDLR